MTKNEIITVLFNSESLNNFVNKFCPYHLRGDLKAEVMIILCEKTEEFIQTAYNTNNGFGLVYFTVNIMRNQLNRKGKFYKNYIRYNRLTTDTVPDLPCLPDDLTPRIKKEAFEDQIVNEVERLHWYERDLLKYYLKVGSLRKVAEQTRIPHSSIHMTIENIRRKIQNA